MKGGGKQAKRGQLVEAVVAAEAEERTMRAQAEAKVVVAMKMAFRYSISRTPSKAMDVLVE